MERSDVIEAIGKLKLYGRGGPPGTASYDEIISTALKRRHEPQQIIHCPAGAWKSHAAGRGRPDDGRDI